MKVKLETLYSDLQGLEQTIQSSKLTPKRYQEIQKKLDVALKSTETLPQGNSLKEKVTELYGKLEDHFAQTKLDNIQKTAARLAKLIHTYKGDHLPSAADKKKLTQASALLSQVPQMDASEIDPEDIYALLDIAKAVYHRDLSLARKQLTSLPESLRSKLSSMIPSPFGENTTQTIQSLMGLCHELLGVGPNCPTADEIDLFFKELSSTPPAPSTKVVPMPHEWLKI